MELKNVDKLPIDIKEAIKKRISTRTYEEKSLTKVDKNKLMDFNRTLSNPFGVDVKVQYISKDKGAEDVQLGTYGTIKIGEDDLFPCICPVGYPSQRRSFIEKITIASLGSRKRKEWDKLFFSEDFTRPLSKAEAGQYVDALEMLRLAPSATNSQPWALVKEGDSFHFFCNYKNGLNSDVKKIKHIDLGIALAHFHQTAMSDGLKGRFEAIDIGFDIPENMHYIITYIAE